MRNYILSTVILAILLLGMAGCAPTIQTPVYTAPPSLDKTTTPDIQSTSAPISKVSSDLETKMMNNTWISPAKVEVGNFYPSARAEWSIRIHNGNDETTQIEKKLVGTSVGETSGTIQLKYPLADGDTSKVSISSDDSKESLFIIGYDTITKSLTIIGFIPDSSRIITIVYKAWAEFSITYRQPNQTTGDYLKAPVEVQSWVIVADATLIFRPKETKEILVALDMPEVIEDDVALMWRATQQGSDYLVTTREQYYQVALKEYEGKDGAEQLALAETEKKMLENPQANLLMYLTNIGSVNKRQFSQDRIGDMARITELLSNELVELKDLRKDKWEFWTSVKEGGQGEVQMEMCTRWLVNMR